jgi:tight adherence protein B
MTTSFAYLSFLLVATTILFINTRKVAKKAAFKAFASAGLQQVGLTGTYGSWLVAVHGIVFCCALIAQVTFGVGLAASIAAPAAIIGADIARKRTKKRKLGSQVESTLSFLSCSLYGTTSITQALRNVANNIDEPMKSQLLIAESEITHGVSIDDSLRACAARIGDDTFTFAVDGIRICRETGSDVSQLLDRIATIARDRHTLSEKIRSLTTQQKATAKFVTLIPVLYLLVMYTLNQNYVGYLATKTGQLIVIYAVLSISVGFWVLHNMSDIKASA